MSSEDLEFIGIFIEEALDLLNNWEKCCLELEEGHSEKRIEALFRCAHNLKGSSSSVGLDKFNEFVHKLEDFIDLLQKGEFEISQEILALLLGAQDTMVKWVGVLNDDIAHVPVKEIDLTLEKIIYFDRIRKVEGSEPKKRQDDKSVANVGEILTSRGAITDDELQDALDAQNRKIGEILVDKGSTTTEAVDQALELQKKMGKKENPNQTIRVLASKLDDLMKTVGELSTQQSIIWHHKQSNSLDSKAASDAILLSHKIGKEIQVESLSLRMQSLQGLLQRMERTIRDASRSLNKKVQIEIEGKNVELDKTVIEKITDPLIHIIRNAVDHGIESSEVRKQSGKNEMATIYLQAVQQTNGVQIIIADDGAGMDKQRIVSKAVSKGLIRDDINLSDEEVYKFVMLPGFSTAENVTDLSGRGVGMDVVQKSVNDIGGTIEIKSLKGKGTAFVISLPTSLSIIDALLIKIGKCIYAVPIQEVSQVIDVGNLEVHTATGEGAVITLRGDVIPLELLRKYLPEDPEISEKLGESREVSELESPEGNDGQSDIAQMHLKKYRRPALLVELGSNRIAFEVDEIMHQQAIVTQDLSGKLKNLKGVNGVTILGNGEPGLILNLPMVGNFFLSQTSNRELKYV